MVLGDCLLWQISFFPAYWTAVSRTTLEKKAILFFSFDNSASIGWVGDKGIPDERPLNHISHLLSCMVKVQQVYFTLDLRLVSITMLLWKRVDLKRSRWYALWAILRRVQCRSNNHLKKKIQTFVVFTLVGWHLIHSVATSKNIERANTHCCT